MNSSYDPTVSYDPTISTTASTGANGSIDSGSATLTITTHGASTAAVFITFLVMMRV